MSRTKGMEKLGPPMMVRFSQELYDFIVQGAEEHRVSLATWTRILIEGKNGLSTQEIRDSRKNVKGQDKSIMSRLLNSSGVA